MSATARTLNEQLILVGVTARDRDDIITRLADLLHRNGYVKDSFCAAVLERERVFPTGLPTGSEGVAIPHTDVTHVLRPGVAVAILHRPVPFALMSNPEETIDVSLVFLLAVNNPRAQVATLQDLVALFQDPRRLSALRRATNPAEVIALLEGHLALAGNGGTNDGNKRQGGEIAAGFSR